MPGSFKDHNNNGLFNFAVHPCDTDEGRGIPAVGKVVFRTDDSTLYVCTSTSPDPTLNGGGTWTAVGTGFSSWSSWTPALTASTTNPTLGTAPSQLGRYMQSGKTVFAEFFIQFGTTPTAGSGNYRISLPVTSRTTNYFVCGSGYLRDDSAQEQRHFTAEVRVGGTTATLFLEGTGGAYTVTDAVPWTWAASDIISGTLMYEAA